MYQDRLTHASSLKYRQYVYRLYLSYVFNIIWKQFRPRIKVFTKAYGTFLLFYAEVLSQYLGAVKEYFFKIFLLLLIVYIVIGLKAMHTIET